MMSRASLAIYPPSDFRLLSFTISVPIPIRYFERTLQPERDDRVSWNPDRSATGLAANRADDGADQRIPLTRFDPVGIRFDTIPFAADDDRIQIQDQVVVTRDAHLQVNARSPWD